MRRCVKCYNYTTGKTGETCCEGGSSSTPRCDGTWQQGRDYPVACKSSYTKCDKCPIYETRSIPETITEYVPPEYKVVCD